ncbi:SWIM zinc finger family protein, partial [Nocardia xishanensis]|uniref:SWIM zinc finger family protein n=1 Tax=Nocardia xishanensis TaxID=238964 RepID=UPI000A7C41EE
MNAPWPEERVGELAPDGSSLAAARGLADRWRDTGCRDDAVWGRCRGSGPEPYATIIDLSGPAYACSCPSRKSPCKHALSLLLVWSRGAVAPSPEVAEFAAEWLAARAARSATPATARTVNPATAEQRRVRVTAGLEELDIWLGDQVRTGLAQADRSYSAFESIAARMVDAQAPGVAGALRRLPLIMATRADWPEPVLREYARLHLLVVAHRRLEDLPPALRASVRTHIGYPNPAESVRAEPVVRDQWMTLGVRSTEDDRLYTRRTWLYGRRTHRWALLVDHAFGAPAFPATAPVLGSMTEADLHYYPGAAPLRALWGGRHGIDEPFTTLPAAPTSPAPPAKETAISLTPSTVAPPVKETAASSTPTAAAPAAEETAASPSSAAPAAKETTASPSSAAPAAKETTASLAAARIGEPDFPAHAAAIGKKGGETMPGHPGATSGAVREALDAHAAALGADPWVRSWPVLLRDVVPLVAEAGWQVVDAQGAALPLAPAEQPWTLLAISGGHPVTVLGEWTADGLVPISAFAVGEMIDVESEPAPYQEAPAPSGETDDLISTALLGTARRAFDPALLPAPAAAAAARLRTDPAFLLL